MDTARTGGTEFWQILSYHDARDIRNAQLLREMLPELPPFCAEFFRGITPETTPLTRLNYARDLLIFFDFLLGYKACCAGKTVPEITCDDMAQITMTDIETYLDYLTAYTRGEKMLHDDEAAKERKLSSLRALLRYLFKRERIPSNVAALVDLPKRHDREIVRLEVDEVAKLLDLVDEGGKDAHAQAGGIPQEDAPARPGADLPLVGNRDSRE